MGDPGSMRWRRAEGTYACPAWRGSSIMAAVAGVRGGLPGACAYFQQPEYGCQQCLQSHGPCACAYQQVSTIFFPFLGVISKSWLA